MKCYHCDEPDHLSPNCPEKGKPWFKVQPKGTNYKKMHRNKEKHFKECLFCTECGTWRYKTMGGHTKKGHANFLKEQKKRAAEGKKVTFDASANVAISEERQEDFSDSEDESSSDSEDSSASSSEGSNDYEMGEPYAGAAWQL